jgi:hypothetical protein
VSHHRAPPAATRANAKVVPNPPGSYTRLNRESPQFIRFINPGDLRVARESCGACHLPIVQASERSLMATSAMLWGGAAYNNGILPFKRYIVGRGLHRQQRAGPAEEPGAVTPQMRDMGILDSLAPLPAWETVPPADVFRVFERGGKINGTQFPEIGLPNVTGALQKLDEPGRPDIRQSNRGPGTGNRIAVPLINITKTRLNDPHLWFLGTNEQPGDYRSSGCTACHTPYANDRDPRHAGPYAKFGHEGKTATSDPAIPTYRSGHPISHQFTRAIPSSQCMVCHMHQPNIFVNSFYGTTMWDYEADAPFMWPKQQKYPTAAEIRKYPGAQSGGGGDPGPVGGSGILEAGVRAQPAAQGHAVRRLPRPRLELPIDLQARPQGHAGGREEPAGVRRGPAEVQEGGAPDLGAPGRGHALRRLPFRAGRARQRPHLRRGGRRDRDRLQGLPRQRQPVPHAVHVRPGGAARRHGHEAAAHAGRPAPLRMARGKLYQRSALDPARWSGRCRWSRIR